MSDESCGVEQVVTTWKRSLNKNDVIETKDKMKSAKREPAERTAGRPMINADKLKKRYFSNHVFVAQFIVIFTLIFGKGSAV